METRDCPPLNMNAMRNISVKHLYLNAVKMKQIDIYCMWVHLLEQKTNILKVLQL